MYNGSEREKVNVDELVDLLIKRREGVDTDEPKAVSEVAVTSTPEPMAEPEKNPENTIAVSEPTAILEEVSEEEDESGAALLLETEPEAVPAVPVKKKKRLSLFKRREADWEDEEESWADWGLKPLGYREKEKEQEEKARLAHYQFMYDMQRQADGQRAVREAEEYMRQTFHNIEMQKQARRQTEELERIRKELENSK